MRPVAGCDVRNILQITFIPDGVYGDRSAQSELSCQKSKPHKPQKNAHKRKE